MQTAVSTIKILIADDHELVREGLKRILKATGEMQVVAEAQDGDQAIEAARATDIDVVILDVSMPGKSGLEVLKILKKEHSSLPVLILSMHPEERFATRMLRAGAAGYITKDAGATELITAIRKVVQRGKYVSPSLAEKLAFDDTGTNPHELLSEREYQVMCMIGKGKTSREIASDLSLSINTINTYRSRILEKMKMTREAELIRYVVENELID